MTLGETFDIGSDTRTSVDENDYQVPFAFNGKVDKVSVQLNRADDALDHFESEIHKDQ
jgi:arylsulfatase